MRNLTIKVKTGNNILFQFHFVFILMKFQDHEKHLKNFQLNFVGLILDEVHNNTIEDLLPNQAPAAQSLDISKIKPERDERKETKKSSSVLSIKKCASEDEESIKLYRMYLFNPIMHLVEILLAYIIFCSFLAIEDKLRFPIFNCLLSVALMYLLQPFHKINMAIVLLGIPINIINYYLEVGILTYPALFILYLSCYVFNEYYKISLLWILNVIVLGLFGFACLPNIYQYLGESSKFIFYFIFPPVLYVVRLALGLSHHTIKHYTDSLIQFPLFLLGIQYGILLTTPLKTAQFWYMMILLTTQIVDQRLQFVLKLIKRLIGADEQNVRWVLTAKCSAHLCLNSFHIVVLVYFICGTKLKSAIYPNSLNYLDTQGSMGTPVIIWIFFTLYEVASLAKVRRREDLFIMGAQFHRKSDILRRILCLSFGLWVFYFGLCIPHSIFY